MQKLKFLRFKLESGRTLTLIEIKFSYLDNKKSVWIKCIVIDSFRSCVKYKLYHCGSRKIENNTGVSCDTDRESPGPGWWEVRLAGRGSWRRRAGPWCRPSSPPLRSTPVSLSPGTGWSHSALVLTGEGADGVRSGNFPFNSILF